MSEAEEYLSNKGYGKGINYSTKEVAYLMQSFADQQNKDANIFIKDIAVMLGMDTDGIRFDGLKFSIEDFEDAIKSLNK